MAEKIEIKHRYIGAVLFEYEPTNEDQASGLPLRYALEAAISKKADLRGADLRGKKLIGERPFFQCGPIGSRNDYLLAFLTDAGVMVRAGCFDGTLSEFVAAVKETHGESTHAQEYAAAVAMIEMHAKLWTPEAEVTA